MKPWNECKGKKNRLKAREKTKTFRGWGGCYRKLRRRQQQQRRRHMPFPVSERASCGDFFLSPVSITLLRRVSSFAKSSTFLLSFSLRPLGGTGEGVQKEKKEKPLFAFLLLRSFVPISPFFCHRPRIFSPRHQNLHILPSLSYQLRPGNGMACKAKCIKRTV